MQITIQSKNGKEIIDITDLAQNVVSEQNFENGILHIFALHTTVALSIADLDPGTDLDILDAIYEMLPNLNYRHPHDPGHVKDHILSCIIGPSLSVPVENGQIILGTWQRIVFLEFNGPQKRKLIFKFTHE